MKGSVVLTGTQRTNLRMAEPIRAAGYDVLEWSALRLVPTGLSRTALDDVLGANRPLVVVSPGVVDVLQKGWPGWTQSPRGGPILSMGPGTTEALAAVGIRVEAEALPPRAEGMIALIVSRYSERPVIGVLCGDRTRPELGRKLRAEGFHVEFSEVYRNQAPESLTHDRRPLVAVVYGSPTSARRILSANPWLREVPAIAIGPTTAHWLEEHEEHARIYRCSSPSPDSVVESLHHL